MPESFMPPISDVTSPPSMGVQSPTPAMGMPDAGGMAGPEQKQELMDLIQKIRAELGQFNATQFAGTNKSQQQRSDLLKEVFMELQAAGVDLRDPQSVADFVAKLRAQSPDMADLFEQAMNQLLGGEPVTSEPAQNTNEMMLPPGQVPMEMNNGAENTIRPPQV